MSTATAPQYAAALNPDACNCVIFRLDDIQDFWLSSVQTEIIDQFINREEDLSLGIVMNFVGNDPAIVNKVKEGAGAGLLELTLHGWNHVDYQGLTQQEQYDTLLQANAKMQELWGRGSKIFIPPYNSYNEDTLAAVSQLGLKIISAEFDQEIDSVFPHEDDPGHPDNKIYMAFEGSDITDDFGVYHLPQEIGFYDYEFEPPVKNSLNRIERRIDNAITNYGYAVVTLHPQDFTIKDSDGDWTPQLDPNEIDDLNELITVIQNKGYHIRTFSSVANIPLPPLVDDTPPVITAPPDIAEVHSTPLTTISDLGTPIVFDNTDTSPTVTNDAPEQFPQGTTIVTWTATDDAGNSATAKQYVTISSSPDNTAPVIAASTPVSNQVINGPAAGVNILIQGTASDGQTGVKVVEVRTEGTSYKTAKQESPGSWSAWSHVLNIQQAGTLTIVSRATDFFNNQQWDITPVTVNLSGPDTTAPVITPPQDIEMEATGPMTVVSLGMPNVFDNSDPSPQVNFNAPGAGESEIGFPVGETTVTWTATDASGNSANATQLVTIVDTTPPTVPELLSPEDGLVTNGNNLQLFWSDATDLVSDVTYDLLVANSSDFASPIVDEEGLVASTYIPEAALADGTYYWKVRASDGQDNESLYSQVGTFTIDASGPTVTASPAGGTYASAQSVTLSASEPATIYYTTDGSTPTIASTVYTAPISLTANTVLKFFAVDSAGNAGPITTESYSFATTFASPSGGTYSTPQSVTLSSGVPNTTIYYTTDGSEPTINSTVYTTPIDISEDTTLKFFGVDAAGNEGAVVTETYIFDVTVPTVSASPPGGMYSSAQTVSLNASEPSTIYYTMDGSQPDTNSTIYTGPVSVTASAELKFFAVDSAGNAGPITTESYVIDTVPPVVSAEPPAGLYNEAVSVILSANEAATIYYTTDETTPTTNSTIYTEPLQISSDTTLKFFGVDAAGNAGAVESETYLFDFEAPTVTAEPPGGTFDSPQSVTLMASESATTIYYTTDGSEPTINSTIYTSPIDVDSDTILRFFAKDLAGNTGPVQTETYTITDTSPPVITAVPPGGSYNTPQNVTLLSDEPATVYYTTDGSDPTTNSTVYDAPIVISDTTTLKFFGVDTAGNTGAVQTQAYTFGSDTIPPTVAASPPGGTYFTEQSVELVSDEPATIYYTTDGSTPTISSPV
ncbi:MAG TPA: chitobiase/beta-hexosaminidase C-terminal domain-containing protein, partial [Nitrososphaera sp.]